MKKLLLVSALTASMVFAPAIMAKKADDAKTETQATQVLKIGVINVRNIMEKSEDVKSIEQTMKKEFQPKMDQVKALDQGLRENVEKLQRNKDVMNESERTKLEETIKKSQQELMTLQSQYQQESSQKQQKLMQEFFDKMNSTVSHFAKENGYDLVLISDAVPYMTDQVDITNNIMEVLKDKS